MPAEQTSPAIVLRTRDYSEADRIVTVLARDAGKLAGIAKGVKQSRRRFERKLEVFSHVMLYFRRRPQGELVFITRAEAADLPAFDLTDDLAKIGLGSYMVELADHLCREETQSAGAYELLADALAATARHGASVALRQAFELRLLRWAGYGLEFGRCRMCEAIPAPQTSSFAFVAAYGGIVCQLCRSSLDTGAIALSGQSVAAMRELSRLPLDAAAHSSAAGGADAQSAIAHFMATILDRRLRSLDFLSRVM